MTEPMYSLSQLRELLKNPDVADVLLGGADITAKKKQARNSSNPEILKVLSRDEDVSVQVLVAGNPATPSECLQGAASSPERLVRLRVASNPSLPPTGFRVLSRSMPEQEVRAKLASNPSCPRDVVEVMSGDDSHVVRSAVARHRKISRETFERLMKDPESLVRKNAASSANATPDDLRTLTCDEVGVVRKSAVQRSTCPPDAVDALAAIETNDTVLMALIGCAGITVDGLIALRLNRGAGSWYRREASKRLEWAKP